MVAIKKTPASRKRKDISPVRKTSASKFPGHVSGERVLLCTDAAPGPVKQTTIGDRKYVKCLVQSGVK